MRYRRPNYGKPVPLARQMVFFPALIEGVEFYRSGANTDPLIDAYRDMAGGGPIENVTGLLVSGVIAIVVLLAGWRMFHQAEFKFAEYV